MLISLSTPDGVTGAKVWASSLPMSDDRVRVRKNKVLTQIQQIKGTDYRKFGHLGRIISELWMRDLWFGVADSLMGVP